jgi:hypothetical protein
MIDQSVKNNNELTGDLASFFDLLGKFDHEDKKKSVIKTGSLVSAPKGPVLGSDQ